MSTTKFKEEDLAKINEMQQTYAKITAANGQLITRRIVVEQELNGIDDKLQELKNQFLDAQKAEVAMAQEFAKVYGDGNLDMATGEFTPAVPTAAV